MIFQGIKKLKYLKIKRCFVFDGMTKIIPKEMQLKTLFLSSKLAISVTVIPALLYKFDEKGKDK